MDLEKRERNAMIMGMLIIIANFILGGISLVGILYIIKYLFF